MGKKLLNALHLVVSLIHVSMDLNVFRGINFHSGNAYVLLGKIPYQFIQLISNLVNRLLTFTCQTYRFQGVRCHIRVCDSNPCQ